MPYFSPIAGPEQAVTDSFTSDEPVFPPMNYKLTYLLLQSQYQYILNHLLPSHSLRSRITLFKPAAKIYRAQAVLADNEARRLSGLLGWLDELLGSPLSPVAEIFLIAGKPNIHNNSNNPQDEEKKRRLGYKERLETAKKGAGKWLESVRDLEKEIRRL